MVNHPQKTAFQINQFPAIIGILSVLSHPLFSRIWGMEPIGAGKYAELLIAFTLLFLFLSLLAFKWTELFSGLCALYVTLVMPVFCVLALLTVIGALSVSKYWDALIILHIVFLLIWLFARDYLLNSSLFNQANRVVLYLLPIGYGLIFWAWLHSTYDLLQLELISAWQIVTVVLFLGLLFLWIFDLFQGKLPTKHKWLIFVLTCFLLAGLVYRPRLYIDREHYNFFMAPLNDFIHGKIPFVNTTSQYGVGVIYALALVFRGLQLPIGYEGLSFIVNILFILQYILLAFMLWKTTDDLALSMAGILAIVYFNFLSVYWPSMLRIPAQSPLRYGPIYLLLCIALLNLKSPNRFFQALEFFFLGIASMWSLETFLYSLVSLDALYFVKDVLFASSFVTGLKHFGRRVMLQAGCVALIWTLFVFLAYTTSGEFPNMQMYLDYYLAYGNIAYSGGEIHRHILRSGAVIFVYLFSIFAVLFDRIQQKKFLPLVTASMLVGMSVTGILQYIYYFVYYADFHLALLCVPLIFVLVLWVGVIRSRVDMPYPLRASLGVVLLISLMTTAIVTSGSFHDKFSKSLLYISQRGVVENRNVPWMNPYQASPSNRSVKILVQFIQRYAGNDGQFVIFALPDDQTEALFLTGKTDILGMSEPEMSSLSPAYSEFVLHQVKAMAGQPTYIFYDTTQDALIPLQQKAFQALINSSDYKIIDTKGNIIVFKKVNS
jgi:hypothetical protein